MLSTIYRLQLAMRIGFALRWGGRAGVDVLRMLRDHGYARAVLARCHDSGDFSLWALADAFGDTLAAQDLARELAHAAASTRAALARLPLGRAAAEVVRETETPHEAALG